MKPDPLSVQNRPAPARRVPPPGEAGGVPIVSAFFGIIIRMFYRDHGVPHFHAEHQGELATFTFDGRLLAGLIRSRTALRLIAEWARSHGNELGQNWERMRRGERLERIEPLD